MRFYLVKKTRAAGLPSSVLATIGLVLNIISMVLTLTIIPLLVLTTYTGIQQKARNSKRQTDIMSLQTQVETYYSQQGYYPSLTDMNNSSWRSKNLPNLDSNSLSDPSNPSNSQLAATPTAHQYSYQVTNKDGGSCENDDTKCAKYTFTATFEGTQDGQSTFARSTLE